MKKILIVAVLLAVMLPLAAADKDGKWFVDMTWGYDQPSGLDTTYAYAYGYGTQNGNAYVSKTKTFDVGTPRAFSPSFRFGYEADNWSAWMSYYKFSKVGHSSTTIPDGYFILFNTLPASQDPLLGYEGFVYSDVASASQKIRNTNWDFNIGRIFHPTDKWAVQLYTGVKYFKLEAEIHALYGDTYDYNYWGAGSQDEVVINSRTSGWGLNAGLKSSTDIGKYVTVTGGLEFSAVHATRTNSQSEYFWSSYYSPYYGAFGSWISGQTTKKVTPIATVFVEGEVKMGEHFYGKVGYKFTTIQNALTFTKLTNDYPFGGFGYVEQNEDLGFDGAYFTLGYRF